MAKMIHSFTQTPIEIPVLQSVFRFAEADTSISSEPIEYRSGRAMLCKCLRQDDEYTFAKAEHLVHIPQSDRSHPSPIGMCSACLAETQREARRKCKRLFRDLLLELGWSGDHYGLRRYGMYIGIETDGYTHT